MMEKDYWMSLGFVPQNVSLFMATRTFELWEETLLNFWYKAKSNSPDGCTGYFKWYVNHKIPMNLFPVLLPVLQLELGRTAHLPLMDCGLHVQGLDDLVMLTGCVNNGNAVYRAIVYKQKFGQELIWSQFSRDLLSNTTNLNYIIELNLPVCNLSSDQLRQIGITFPNLQRLDLSQNEVCLRRLQSLRTIASYCHHLQGLNLFGIPAVKVEDQIQFWEILSDMKLTHLAIDLCLTLPSTEDDKQKMIKMFEKCSSLQVLEANIGFCHQINMKLTILSHFSSLVFYRTHSISIDQSAVLQDLLAGCKALKFLSVTVHSSRISVLQSFPLISYCSLQQLLVTSIATDLSDNFTSMISVHGGLEHVVLYVRSVTSEGVTVLVKNSPSLMTFHVIARIFQHTETHERIDPNVLEMRIKQEYSQHRLFVFGSYIIKVDSWLDLLDHHRNSDLFSMWSLT
ncbi:uncharacterized protein [Dysidea avara]|uniref:uncharacterized protein n=1 Tax=Dysidea avara TaxID=196820 RepID=UPI00332C6EF1